MYRAILIVVLGLAPVALGQSTLFPIPGEQPATRPDAPMPVVPEDGGDGAAQATTRPAVKIVQKSNDQSASSEKIKNIIFVCDGSGSMIGGKDEALRIELKKAVWHLSPEQTFNVIVFHEVEGMKFEPMAGNLLDATEANKKRALKFVDDKLEFHGITNPLPAMREAFKEHPQMIYMLTDGDFEDNDPAEKSDNTAVMNAIAEMNKAGLTHINTILLLGKWLDVDELKDAEPIMKKIANDNDGVFLEAVVVKPAK